jgi:hypothetical protein
MRLPSPRRAPAAALPGVLAFAFYGCGGGGTEPRVPSAVALDPTMVAFTAIGQTQQFSASVTDQDGGAIASPDLTWVSSNTAVAAVSASGLVSAVGNGSANITATAGAATATVPASVSQTPAAIAKVAGDGQAVAPGQTLLTPLTVQVNDALGAPVPGVTVTFSAEPSGGTVVNASVTTGADGRASTGFTLLATGTQQVTAAVASTPLTASFSVIGVSPFKIELSFNSQPTPTQQQAFAAAQQRWQTLITSELPDVALSAPASTCGPNSPAIQRQVDDVMILIDLEPIDGPGGTLGESGPCYIRNTSSLPVLGVMRFDTADLDAIESAGLLQPVILHEMAHVLGYGTIWTLRGLLAGPALSGGLDPHFTGSRAIAEFNAAGGTTYVGGLKVPVEDTGGEGTADAHWRESVFGNELMTGFVDPGVNPLSRVSIASMADLGYSVNLLGADPYMLGASLRVFGGRPALELPNDVLRLPLHVVDGEGRLTRIEQP